MTIYDAAMVVLVVAGMVWGAWRGITWQLASIASLILGYSVAHPLSEQLAPRFPGEPIVARSLAMLAVYVAVSGGVFLVAWIVRATLRQLKFEAFDRHLGMVLGGLEGALLGLVMTLFAVSLAPQTRTPIFASPTGRVVGQVLNTFGPVLPGELREVLAPFWNSAESLAGDGETLKSPSMAREEPGGSVRSSSEADASPLRHLIEEGEARVGKAIAETAEKEFQQAGGRNGREVERR
jgi:membrane protein required for colicin V production